MKVVLKPISSFSFGTGKPFSPQMRGPISHQTTYLVPPPSTVAGTLASIAYRQNENCAQVDDSQPFAATVNCLKELLGNNFHIRGSFIELQGKVLFETYKGLAELPLTREELDKFFKCVNEIRSGRVKIGHPLKTNSSLKKFTKIGIALNRQSKSTLEGMLYSIERLSPLQGSEIFVEVRGKGESFEELLRFGSDGGLALTLASEEVIVHRLRGLWGSRKGGKCVLVLTTPLIPEIELDVEDPNTWIELEDLVRSYLRKEIGTNETVPGTRVNVEMIPLGWEMRGKRQYPRPYALAIAPGAMFYSECEDWEATYWKGAGKYSKLGYGTLVPLPFFH